MDGPLASKVGLVHVDVYIDGFNFYYGALSVRPRHRRLALARSASPGCRYPKLSMSIMVGGSAVLQMWKHGKVNIATTSTETSCVANRKTKELDWYEQQGVPGDRDLLGPFGHVPVATSIPEFIRIAQVIAKEADHNGICGWRGQVNCEWYVQSGAARRVQGPWLEHFGRDYESVQDMLRTFGVPNARDVVAERGSSMHGGMVHDYERLLLNEGRVNGFGYQDGRRLSDLELLASLQHHGAATSLLDITKNVLVALWMATTSQDPSLDNQPGVVVAFGQAPLRTISAEFAENKALVEIMKSMRGENRRAGYWIPSKLNLRIVAQSGFFLLSPIVNQPWGTVNLRGTIVWEDENIEDPDCYFIGVSPELKKEMRNAQKYGLLPYAENTIYPDLSGFAAYHGSGRPLPYRR
ncbi:FRG domain-containing protein [Rhodococcus sp. C26F]